MKFHILYSLIFAFVLILSFSAACFKSRGTESIFVQGNELDEYADIDTYIQGDITEPIFSSDFYQRTFLVYYRHKYPIKIEIFMTENNIIPLRIVDNRIALIFGYASEHLFNNFAGIIVNEKLYLKILACCIEFGMRRKNTKYYELNENINCVNKLGLDGSQFDPNWVSTAWTAGKNFELFM